MRFIVLIGMLLGFGVAYVGLVRPQILNWGATPLERQETLPGDEIVPNVSISQTHAITIHANTSKVWPWIAQLGQDRGGFYTFDLIQNLLGCDMPTSDFIRVDKQQWRFGSRLWMYPKRLANGVGYASVRAYEPGLVLGFGTSTARFSTNKDEDGSWTFVLIPLDASTTRLLVRSRGPLVLAPLTVSVSKSILEPVHFVMEKRMMIGIKELSEGQNRGRLQNNILVALWGFTIVLGFSSFYHFLRGWNWFLSLANFGFSLFVLLVLTLVQPPVWVGALLVIALCATPFWQRNRVRGLAHDSHTLERHDRAQRLKRAIVRLRKWDRS